MKNQTRVVVIGGGIAGCSTLYHLTQEGWTDVVLVERNGAPRGEKFFALVNPPVVNPQLGIRRSYVTETRRLAVEFLRRGLQVIVFAQSRLITEVLTTYIKQACRRLPGGSEAIRGYRGGYLPLRRRDIERGLRAGTVSGVVSTSALELGIDIGALDVCVMAGYPGTIAATWQRAGRAGRRSTRSAAVMVASSAPITRSTVCNCLRNRVMKVMNGFIAAAAKINGIPNPAE